MPEISTLGLNIRRKRRELGLSQDALAAVADVGADTIYGIERGKRQGMQVATLMKIANALDCEPGELAGKRERLGERHGASVLALRDALTSPTLLGLPGLDAGPDGDPVPVPDLVAAVDRANARYWSGDFTRLVTAIPELIASARLAAHSLGEAAVSYPLAQAYQLAACTCVHLGRDDLATVGAERAVTAARAGDDEVLHAMSIATLSWVLLHAARTREAERLAVHAADLIEPAGFSADDEVRLAAYGNAMMVALPAAVAQGRDPEDYVSTGAAVAARLGRRVELYGTAFGPDSVRMQACYAAAMLDQPGKALKAAEQVTPGSLTGISWGRHNLDLAYAQSRAGRTRDAVKSLRTAANVSPVWFRHQGIARQVVHDVREAERRLSPTVRELAEVARLDDDGTGTIVI